MGFLIGLALLIAFIGLLILCWKTTFQKTDINKSCTDQLIDFIYEVDEEEEFIEGDNAVLDNGMLNKKSRDLKDYLDEDLITGKNEDGDTITDNPKNHYELLERKYLFFEWPE